MRIAFWEISQVRDSEVQILQERKLKGEKTLVIPCEQRFLAKKGNATYKGICKLMLSPNQ